MEKFEERNVIMSKDQAGKDFLIGAMIGSTVGALSAMMFTTKKGHQIQGEIAEKYHDVEKLVKSYAFGQKRKVKKAVRKAKRTVKKVRRKLKRA